jgi:hypothetical protein
MNTSGTCGASQTDPSMLGGRAEDERISLSFTDPSSFGADRKPARRVLESRPWKALVRSLVRSLVSFSRALPARSLTAGEPGPLGLGLGQRDRLAVGLTGFVVPAEPA